MKNLLLLLVIGLAAYGAYSAYQQHGTEWFGLETRITNPEEETVTTPDDEIIVLPAKREPQVITCPTCTGEGRLSYVDSRGKNHSYACPVCGFRGSNTIQPPDGAVICADCKGMGKTELRKTRNDIQGYIVSASRCQRCNASGWILPRSIPGSQGPSRGVTQPAPLR